MSRRPNRVRASRAVGLLALMAACTPGFRPPGHEGPAGAVETWVVARDASVGAGVTAPTAPALAVSAHGAGHAVLEVPPLAETRIAATLVGPIATIERTKVYTTPAATTDGFITFTPPHAPARQDYLVRLGRRTLAILVREPAEARALAGSEAHASLVTATADGQVVIPAGPLPGRAAELTVETVGLVPWHDGAYELTVPRVPEGDVAFTADVYGPGPIVVVNSPSHAIDAAPDSIEHLHVALREPRTLCDDDFVLRYRIDPADRPGAIVVQTDGAEQVVALVVHPLEVGHEPVAASDVTIDWNGIPVTEVRPAKIGRVSAGAPLVVLARAAGAITGPIVVRARVGRETRTLTLARSDAVPATGLRALPSLWARASGAAAPRR